MPKKTETTNETTKNPKTTKTTKTTTATPTPATGTTTGAAATAAATQNVVETVRTIWLQTLKSQVAAAEALESETIRLTRLTTSVLPFTPAPVQKALVDAAEKGTTVTKEFRQELIRTAEKPWTTEAPAKTVATTTTNAARTAIDLALKQLTVAENLSTDLQSRLEETNTEAWDRVRKDVPEPYATAFESIQAVQTTGTKAVATTVALATRNARTALQALQTNLAKTN